MQKGRSRLLFTLFVTSRDISSTFLLPSVWTSEVTSFCVSRLADNRSTSSSSSATWDSRDSTLSPLYELRHNDRTDPAYRLEA